MNKNWIIRLLILQGLLLFSSQVYSQVRFTKELKWTSNDSITAVTFNSENQIAEWGKGQGRVYTHLSRKLFISGNSVCVLIIDMCSGIYCPAIYVFKEKNKLWYLLAFSVARLEEPLKIESEQDKIIFKVTSGQIGEFLVPE